MCLHYGAPEELVTLSCRCFLFTQKHPGCYDCRIPSFLAIIYLQLFDGCTMLFSLSMLGNSTWSLRHCSLYSLWINNFKNLSLHWFSSDFIIGPLHIFSRSYIACRNNNYKKPVEFVITFLTLLICQKPEAQEAKRCYSLLLLLFLTPPVLYICKYVKVIHV